MCFHMVDNVSRNINLQPTSDAHVALEGISNITLCLVEHVQCIFSGLCGLPWKVVRLSYDVASS